MRRGDTLRVKCDQIYNFKPTWTDNTYPGFHEKYRACFAGDVEFLVESQSFIRSLEQFAEFPLHCADSKSDWFKNFNTG